jgi:hypothetical protein
MPKGIWRAGAECQRRAAGLTVRGQGVLAIWNDCRAGDEAVFESWFQGEHLEERLNVPGFLYGRRHQAISGSAGYFNFYVVETTDVLTSKPYLDRLDNPTPLTRRIMSGVFMNMNRTICRRMLRRGLFRGGYAVTARFDGEPDADALNAVADVAEKDPGVAAAEIWMATEAAGQPVAEEERLRGGDRKIKACLMIDTLRQADAERLGARLARDFPAADVGVFRVLCEAGDGSA